MLGLWLRGLRFRVWESDFFVIWGLLHSLSRKSQRWSLQTVSVVWVSGFRDAAPPATYEALAVSPEIRSLRASEVFLAAAQIHGKNTKTAGKERVERGGQARGGVLAQGRAVGHAGSRKRFFVFTSVLSPKP